MKLADACLTIAAASVACVAGPEDTTLATPPDDPGKADVSSGVVRKGLLPVGETVEADFTTDFEFHAWSVVLAAGGRVRLEVTRQGSTPSLATGLFVYGPVRADGSTGESIARDYDSGWRRLSRLELSSATMGRYLVVLGTRDGLGRGHYRLSATCTNGACDRVDEAVWLSCDGISAESVRECVADGASALDPGDTPDYGALLAGCTARDRALRYFESACGPEAMPAAFCPGGPDLYAARMMPTCRATLAPEYELGETIDLDDLALPEEIEAMIEVAGEGCDACSASAAAYTYPAGATPSLDVVLASVRALQREPDPADWTIDGAATAERLTDALGHWELAGWLEASRRAAGATETGIGSVSTSFYVAAGAEEWVTIWVVHFPATRTIETVTVAQGET